MQSYRFYVEGVTPGRARLAQAGPFTSEQEAQAYAIAERWRMVRVIQGRAA